VLDDLPTTPGATGAVAELLETTPQGNIPRIGPNGETPFERYARVATAASDKPRIAIVMTGMGLNQAGTFTAIDRLPSGITFAFAPYGGALEQAAAAAHAGGHELMLQVPLEPAGYPQTNPGPETLLTGQGASGNRDKLAWLMGRFTGYVGLVNYMGSRFTTSSAEMGALMAELAARGLGYLDDGATTRSLAPDLASAKDVPFVKADLTLDITPARAAILSALAELTARARRNGSAVAVISALPISIETLAEWAGALEGVELVPVSALMKG
jgi:polysaccharide deacetylase 2 family uncharacterized protein YibQ